ncbi:MAG: hypothetical protein AAFQ23_14905, partial [Cyanobacteria bacterium J06623_1]
GFQGGCRARAKAAHGSIHAADPWLDEDTEAQDLPAIVQNQEDSATLAIVKPESKLTSTQDEAKHEPISVVRQHPIADTLVELGQALIDRMQPVNPLWYMDVLEKALANNWILTTDEVEQLIDIKLHCHHDETEYQRGCWIFIKAGRIGAQIGWRVRKRA